MNVIEPILWHAHTHPKHPALVAGDRTFTYRGLMVRVTRIAAGLSRAGTQRGDLVAIVTAGFLPQILLTLATAWLGATSIALTRADAKLAKGFGVKLLVHDTEDNEDDKPLEVAGVPSVSLESLKPAKGEGEVESINIVQLDPEEIFRVAMSSGTTGKPKAMKYSHGSALVRCQMSRLLYPPEPRERLMVMMGLDLSFAVSYWLRTLQIGGTVVRCAQTHRATLDEMRKHRVTLMLTSSGNAIKLAAAARKAVPVEGPLLPDLRALVVGGAAVSPGVQESLRTLICPTLGINYGTSESGAVATLDVELQKSHPGCAGRRVPWADVEALDDKGQLLPYGKAGTLRIRSMGLASGYLTPEGEPEDTSSFRDGWFYSSDRGKLSADGVIYLTGRRGEILNLGGNKIEPAVVEEVITRDPAITEAAVLQLPDASGEQVLVALVVSDERVKRKSVRERCAQVLGAGRTPKLVMQVPSLPRNENGKLMRGKLASLAKAQHKDAKTGRDAA